MSLPALYLPEAEDDISRTQLLRAATGRTWR
jgi:hypothetical protein